MAILRNRGGDLSKEWYVEYYSNGKRKKIKGGINRFHTKEEREKAAKEIIANILGQPAQNDFKGLVSSYLENRKSEWRKNTYSGNNSVLSLFADWLGNRAFCGAIINEYRNYLLQRLGVGAVNQHIICLKTFFSRLEENNDYFKGIKNIRHEHTPAKVFTLVQEEKILQIFERENQYLYLFALLMRYTLSRPNNEIRLLKVSDINFDEGYINIITENSKVKTNRRPVMPNILREKLSSYLKNKDKESYIFAKNGKIICASSLYAWHREILRREGMESEYTPYSWKHTGAIRMYNQFKDIIMVQKQCGHTDPSTTYKYLRQLGLNEFSEKIRDFV